MRLFIFADGNEVASFEAQACPRVGEEVWLKTFDYEGTIVVQNIEHQFDRSCAERFSSHDVCVFGTTKASTNGAVK